MKTSNNFTENHKTGFFQVILVDVRMHVNGILNGKSGVPHDSLPIN